MKASPEKEATTIRDLKGRGQAGHPVNWVAEMSLDREPPVEEPTATFIDVLGSPRRGTGRKPADRRQRQRRRRRQSPVQRQLRRCSRLRHLSHSTYLEDGRSAGRSDPPQVGDQGTIKGWLPGQALPPQCLFAAEIGFVAGAT